MDVLPEIKEIVRDAILDGLINSETLERYDFQVEYLEGAELEAYIQKLWDEL